MYGFSSAYTIAENRHFAFFMVTVATFPKFICIFVCKKTEYGKVVVLFMANPVLCKYLGSE